jgi:glycosyltransferase involved in cell wall biosynthesis
MASKDVAAKPKYLMPWEWFNQSVKTVGVIDPCYGSSHVIYPVDVPGFTHKRLSKLPIDWLDKDSTYHKFTPVIMDAAVTVVHTWNAIPRNKNFIISFELEIPRYLGNPTDEQIEHGLAILNSPRCKAIAALSEFAAYNATRFFNKKGYPQLTEKLSVLRGMVPDPRERFDITPKVSEGPGVSAVVIGTQLFRKGGMYAIQAFEKLKEEGYDVQLTLIGKFEANSYVYGDHIPSAAEWTERAKSHEWIRFLPPIPNKQVYEELASHDVCLYPSLDESLGWLPIESAMLGVPVVACNIAAFPEFVVDGETGFLVDLPLGENKRWAGLEETGEIKANYLADANEKIVEGIYHAFKVFIADKSTISQMGHAGRTMIMPKYSAEQARSELTALYEMVL